MNKIVFFVMFSGFIFGQNINILPSIANPEISSLGKFLDNPTNLSNGQTSINIDLVTLNDKDFNVPISLNYNTSGVRVSEIASRVGLGWSINTGGFIFRSTRGLPDDDNNGYLNSIKVADFLNLTSAKKSQVLQSENDFESDVYTFNFFGISGEFYFDQNGNIYTHKKNDFIIEPKFSGNKILGWLITITNGTKFYLGLSKDNLRTANDLSTSAGTTNVGNTWSLLDFPAEYINTWHLVDIETQNKKLISYEYESSNVNYWNLASQEHYLKSPQYHGTQSRIHTTYIKNEDKINRVKKIHSNSGIIEFYYEQPREDLVGDFTLNKVILKKDNTIIDSYILNYNYHISDPIYNNSISFENKNQRNKRLILNSIVQNINYKDNKKYIFEYYTNKGFPERLSFSQDHWGYFNGKLNTSFFPKTFMRGLNFNLVETIGGDKYVDEEFSNALTLKKITYPTGGYTVFDFETNKTSSVNPIPEIAKYDEEILYEYGSQLLNGTEDRIFTITNLDPSNQYLSWEVIFNSQCNNSVSLDCPFAQLYLFVNGVYQLVSNSNGEDMKKYFAIPESECGNLNIKIVFNNFSQSFNEDGRNDFTVKIFKNSVINPYQVSVGGIRTKQLKYFNHNNKQISTKKFNYNFFNSPKVSSGLTLFTPFFFIEDFPIMNGKVKLLKSNSIFPLYNNGNSVVYTEVEEINENEEIGKTEYYFSFVPDGMGMTNYNFYKFFISNNGENFAINNEDTAIKNLLEIETPKENYSNSRCVLLKTKKFSFDKLSNSYNTVFEDINIYDFKKQTTNTHRIKNIFVKRLDGSFGYAEYNIFLERLNLIGNIKNTYFNSKIVQEKTNYFYGPDNYNSRINLIEEKKHTSSGDIIDTVNYYAHETNNTALITKNMIGIPLITKSYKNNVKLSTNETVYKNWGNNFIAPEIIKSSKGNAAMEDRIKFNVLDNVNGNVLEIQQESGIKISYIYGYNKTQPVAKIENIAYSTIPNNFITDIQNASNGNNEQALLTALTALRNNSVLANAMITTITYKPLIGISTITDPKGDTQTYHYDSFNRLQFVKDKDGNILSENEYHYKN